MTIFTIGHSNRSIEEFVDILQTWHISRLIDIRSLPGSRQLPHFNSEQLSEVLSTAGIEYLHLKVLGGLRKKTKGESPNAGWKNPSFRYYADYMLTEGFQAGLEELIVLATEKRTAVMCAEAVPWRCHRQLVADALRALRSVPVLHIIAKDQVQEHELTRFAQVGEGKLTYPPSATDKPKQKKPRREKPERKKPEPEKPGPIEPQQIELQQTEARHEEVEKVPGQEAPAPEGLEIEKAREQESEKLPEQKDLQNEPEQEVPPTAEC
jgi:hypothetical protein